MRARKNVGVAYILGYANIQLSRTDEYADRNFKAGICLMIEKVLDETNNYKGFHFLNREAAQDERTNSSGEEFYNRHYY